MKTDKPFQPLNIAVLTVSDTRDESDNKAADRLCQNLCACGHQLSEQVIVAENRYRLRAMVSVWIASSDVQAVLVTGGTGFSPNNITLEALSPLFDQTVPGFGELFRQLSFEEIGASTLQSRAIAGMANGTVIFCLPGSEHACQLGWEKLIQSQLDNRSAPCSFVPHLKHS